MKLLAFDTSSEVLSVALFEGDRLVGQVRASAFVRHSSSLAPSLEQAMKAHGMKPSGLGAIAVGLGPGSFTGLRVGVVTAEALAYALGCRIAGVSSQAAVAASAEDAHGDIVVIQDAKRERLYAAVYRRERNGVREVRAPFIGTLKEAMESAHPGAFFTGDAAVAHREALERAGFRAETDREKTFPSAAWVGRLALPELARAKGGARKTLTPLYLYPKDCNVTLAKKKK